jgi:hypothetical protein
MEVDVRGRLYEKNDVRYIDLLSVTLVSPPEEEVGPDDEEDWSEYGQEEEEEEEEQDEDWDS